MALSYGKEMLKKSLQVQEHFDAKRHKKRTSNQDAQWWISIGLDKSGFDIKFLSDLTGFGIVTTKPFAAGEFLLEYKGNLIIKEEAGELERKHNRSREGSFMYHFVHEGKELCIDGTDSYDRLARMVNDSDHGNAKMAVVEYKEKPHLCLFAVRDISIGEEVVYDYGVDDLPWHNSRCQKRDQPEDLNSTVCDDDPFGLKDPLYELSDISSNIEEYVSDPVTSSEIGIQSWTKQDAKKAEAACASINPREVACHDHDVLEEDQDDMGDDQDDMGEDQDDMEEDQDEQPMHESGNPINTHNNITATTTSKPRKGYIRRPCPFCGVFQSKLSRHMSTKHKNEKEVGNALKLPPKGRIAAFNGLKKTGIFQHNSLLIKQNKSKDLVRERHQGNKRQLVVCGDCQGFYDKVYIWSHKKSCPGKSVSAAGKVSVPVSLLVPSLAGERFKLSILSKFRDDDVGQVCRQDPTILLVGERLFGKLRKKPDKETEVKRSVMADMRKLGNLYKEFTVLGPAEVGTPPTAVDMLSRRNFGTLEQAIENYTRREGDDLKSGLKSTLYYLLKNMATIVKASYIADHKDNEAAEIDKFVILFELNHSAIFGDATYKINQSRQTQLRRPQNLPAEEDIAKVRNYTIKIMSSLVLQRDSMSSQNYKLLRDLTVCRLTLFNFRRGGEPARLLLKEWNDAKTGAWLNKSRIHQMPSIDKSRFENMKVMYQTGKGNNHLVPVLVPKDCDSSLHCLADPKVRKAVGIESENPYVFPVSNDSGHCSGWHSVNRICLLADVKECSAITATKMRHFSSTYYAGLDVPENERAYFYNHMGHSKEINAGIYQTPLAEAEVTIVGKVLEQIDQGFNMNAIVDVPADEHDEEPAGEHDEEPAGEHAEEPAGEPLPAANDLNQTEQEDSTSQQRRRYTKWAPDDSLTVQTYFHESVSGNGRLPGIKEIQKFRELNPGIPHDCYIIKAKVFNERKTQKKRLEKEMCKMML